MGKKILIIVICTFFIVIAIYFATLGNNTEEDIINDQDNGNNDNNNGLEPENCKKLDQEVDLLISSDKTEYISGETIDFTLTVINNMNISYPYENRSFRMWYVDKSDYSTPGGFSPVSMPEVQSAIDLIRVEPGEETTFNVYYNSTNVDPGEYYFQFIVQAPFLGHPGSITVENVVMCEIKII